MEDSMKARIRKTVNKGDETKEASVGARPENALYTFVKVDEPTTFQGSSDEWTPVVFKCSTDGQEYSFSMSTLCRSTDLSYACGRNLGKRSDWWCEAKPGDAAIFYEGRVDNAQFTARNNMTLDGKVFTKGSIVPAGTIKFHRFKKQTLG